MKSLILLLVFLISSVFAQIDSVYVNQNVYTGELVKHTSDYVIIKSETGAEDLLMRKSITRMVLKSGEIVFLPKLNREQGKNLIITLYSGTTFKGELLVLTETALYVTSDADSDDSTMHKIQYDDIYHIQTLNEGHLLANALFGGVAGSAFGALTSGSGVLLGVVMGGLSNLLVMDTHIQFSELSQQDLKQTIIKLGESARFFPVPSNTNIPAIRFPELQPNSPLQVHVLKVTDGQKRDHFRVRVGTLYHPTGIIDNYKNLLTENGFNKSRSPTNSFWGRSSGTAYPKVSIWKPSFSIGLDYMVTDRLFLGVDYWSKSGSVEGRDTYTTIETRVHPLGFEYEHIIVHEVLVSEEHKVSSTYLYIGYRHIPEHLIINQYGFSLGAGLSYNSIYHNINAETRSSLLFEDARYGVIAFASIDWYASPGISVSIIPQINWITSQSIQSYDWTVDDNPYVLPAHSVKFGGYAVNCVLAFSL